MIKVVFLHAHAQAEFVTDAMMHAKSQLELNDNPLDAEYVKSIIECAMIIHQHRGSFPHTFEIEDSLVSAFEEITEFQGLFLQEAIKSGDLSWLLGYSLEE